ncbi:MAG: DinB family protein [Candidatus Hydrogenedentes bacterium]|nr:DinB family protein [Candidatus Hydrogenedentota bacterium]
MSNPQVDVYVSLLETCVADTLRVAGAVRPADRLIQLKPGKAHPMWLVGHLTNTLNTVILQWVLAEESELTREFGKKFAPDFANGDPITANAADYPSWDEVIGLYGKLGDCVIERLKKLRDSDLPLPLKGPIPEARRDIFKSNQITLARMVGHDSYHRGQIGLLSKINP